MSQAMTDCPVCGNELPAGAPRCKHCFSDLTEHWSGGPKGGNPLLGVLLMALIFGAALTLVYQQVAYHDQLGDVTIDPREERLVLVYTSNTAPPSTRQIEFGSMAGIEMEATEGLMGGNLWQVFVITNDSERILINRSGSPLEAYASNVAQHTNKQLTIINKIRSGESIRDGI